MKKSIIPGLICVAILAAISYLISLQPWLTSAGISSLVIAIILGILLGNATKLPDRTTPGIQFSAKRILRLAIILYGFRVSFQQIASVGVEALIIDTIVVCSTIMLGYYIGRKFFKLDKDLSLLIGCGAGICGAAAVLAAEDILKSEPFKASIAVGTVVLFGTLSMFIYPALQHAHLLGFSDAQFGIFAGASVHEVAQALVTGSSISVATGKTAVIVKMIRVLLLVPVLFALSLITKKSSGGASKVTIPWFALGFLLVIAFNSLHLLSANFIQIINQIDIILLTMAMGAIGIETKYSKIKHVGMKPLYLAMVLMAWLFGSVWGMVMLA
jgi:uncharacterized integral membrane protein (TIGR00698 family)